MALHLRTFFVNTAVAAVHGAVIELEYTQDFTAYELDVTALHAHPEHEDRFLATTSDGLYLLSEAECTVSCNIAC